MQFLWAGFNTSVKWCRCFTRWHLRPEHQGGILLSQGWLSWETHSAAVVCTVLPVQAWWHLPRGTVTNFAPEICGDTNFVSISVEISLYLMIIWVQPTGHWLKLLF